MTWTYCAYDHDGELYEDCMKFCRRKSRETSELARTSFGKSCHELRLTSTHASFVRFLWYFSSNSSARRQGTMTTTGHFNAVLSSPLVLSVFFTLGILCILPEDWARELFLGRRSRLCGWRFREKQKTPPLRKKSKRKVIQTRFYVPIKHLNQANRSSQAD